MNNFARPAPRQGIYHRTLDVRGIVMMRQGERSRSDVRNTAKPLVRD